MKKEKVRTMIFAHRGASGEYPENTLLAFQKAAEQEADGLELDIHLTKDQVPVVIHDRKVDRTTDGKGWVFEHTLEELKQLDAGSWKDPSFQGEQIPTLEEVLAWAKDTSLFLNIELKIGLRPYSGLVPQVLEQIAHFKLEDRVIISSFNHYSLVEVRQLNPAIETAILFMEGLYQPWEYAKGIGAQGLHCYLPVAQPELLRGAAEAGMPVRPFTVNDPNHMKKLIQAQCAGFFTDWPVQARQLRDELQ